MHSIATSVYYGTWKSHNTNLLDKVNLAADIDAHANNGADSSIHTCPKDHIRHSAFSTDDATVSQQNKNINKFMLEASLFHRQTRLMTTLRLVLLMVFGLHSVGVNITSSL